MLLLLLLLNAVQNDEIEMPNRYTFWDWRQHQHISSNDWTAKTYIAHPNTLVVDALLFANNKIKRMNWKRRKPKDNPGEESVWTSEWESEIVVFPVQFSGFKVNLSEILNNLKLTQTRTERKRRFSLLVTKTWSAAIWTISLVYGTVLFLGLLPLFSCAFKAALKMRRKRDKNTTKWHDV